MSLEIDNINERLRLYEDKFNENKVLNRFFLKNIIYIDGNWQKIMFNRRTNQKNSSIIREANHFKSRKDFK